MLVMPYVRFRWFGRLATLAGLLVSAAAPVVADAAPAGARQASGSSVGKPTAARPASVAKSKQKSTRTPTVRASKPRTSPAAARRARLARARAARLARELREVQTPRYKTDESGALVPDIRAEAAIVYNPVTQEVLWAENENEQRSIASITKVMTAVVFLEHEFDLSRQVAVNPADMRGASVTYLRKGERLTANDVLHLTLIASDNAAARTLARISPLGPEAFIDRMNAKAVELGLTHTHYADPSGLDAENTSSAYDMARLIAFASADERISPIMRLAAHTITTSRRTITIHNTNRLVGTEVDVRGGKTGFIRKSGYCLATLLRLPQIQDPIAVVVLGARSNAARFWETRHIFNWLASRTAQVVGSAGTKGYE
jgi:D-alanyl-D-alanine endopeptidase (penicillin-binding protein 7)